MGYILRGARRIIDHSSFTCYTLPVEHPFHAAPLMPDIYSHLLFFLLGAALVLVVLYTARQARGRRRARAHRFESSAPRPLVLEMRPASAARERWDSLTDRQREIARAAARGKRQKEIAAELHLSVKTVETHMHNIHTRLSTHSVLELQRLLRELGEKPDR